MNLQDRTVYAFHNIQTTNEIHNDEHNIDPGESLNWNLNQNVTSIEHDILSLSLTLKLNSIRNVKLNMQNR